MIYAARPLYILHFIYMSGFMTTVLKTKSGGFFYSGFMKTVLKTESNVFFVIIILIFFFLAFAMTATCKSYLALKVENFLPHVSFIYQLFFPLFIGLPPPFQFVLSLAQAKLV